MRRRNPDADSVILIAAAAGVGWWWWNRSKTTGAPGAPAAAIVSNAIAQAGMAINPANAGPTLSTWAPGTGPNPSSTVPYVTADTNTAAELTAFYAANPTIPVAPATPPHAGDVLVSGFDTQGNPIQQWTGPGTANPQAGEIAGANPGLVQLSQFMGMTPAQTQAWINSTAK